MALEYGTFEFGSGVLPLTSSTTNKLLLDADPALSYALDFFAWGLENYISARLKTQAALVGLALPGAVALKVSTEPSPFLYSTQFKFPIFALYRKHDAWDEHTIGFDKSTSTWAFSYVLPPLNPTQQDALNPILRSAAAVIRRLAHQGWDPGYLSGAAIWDAAKAGVQKARLVECSYGGYEPLEENDKYYRAVNGTLEVLEREMYVSGAFQDWNGADVEIDLKDPSQDTTVNDVADFDTYPAPTLTSASPSTGTKQGGTTVTLTGTGFRTGTTPTITFGGVAATAVTVVSATSITCKTPAHDAFTTFAADIVITDVQGLSATLTAGFTFTSP